MSGHDTPRPDSGATPRDAASVVHHISYASQPYVTRACDQSTGYVDWEQPTPPVYRVSDGWSYCFDDDRVTCTTCLNAIAGESLDELLTSLAAERKRERDLANGDDGEAGS